MVIKPQVVKSLDYEIIRNDKYMEARIYVPRKRTIEVSGRFYFLQFPQILAVKVILEREPRNYWAVAPAGSAINSFASATFYHNNPCSFLNFAFVNDGLVYRSNIYQVDYVADKLGVCLVGAGNHAYWPKNTNLTEMMKVFWTTSFSYDGRQSYRQWQELNLNDILEKISKSPSETLDSHLLKLENLCHSVSNAVRINEERESLARRAEVDRKAQVTKSLNRAWAVWQQAQRKKLEENL